MKPAPVTREIPTLLFKVRTIKVLQDGLTGGPIGVILVIFTTPQSNGAAGPGTFEYKNVNGLNITGKIAMTIMYGEAIMT